MARMLWVLLLMNPSELGRKMAHARCKKNQERVIDPEVLAEVLFNPPLGEGDPIGSNRINRARAVVFLLPENIQWKNIFSRRAAKAQRKRRMN